jgi:uncharacterized protein YjiS (DUF1127 family)
MHASDPAPDLSCRSEPAGIPRTSLPARVSYAVRLWWHRAEGRALLRQMDAQQLHDIGLTREDAMQEARKHFWMP